MGPARPTVAFSFLLPTLSTLSFTIRTSQTCCWRASMKEEIACVEVRLRFHQRASLTRVDVQLRIFSPLRATADESGRSAAW
jgi:hypothetical protein